MKFKQELSSRYFIEAYSGKKWVYYAEIKKGDSFGEYPKSLFFSEYRLVEKVYKLIKTKILKP